ncbi:MAG: uroporphyrinogen decarboxylase family protein [Candidatus Humimicrobiaceae bacterium]
MNSRERLKQTLSHKQPDKLPIDFGGTFTTGIHVSMIYKLRQYYGLDKPLTPVKVTELYQMLGEISKDLKKIIGIDTIDLQGSKNLFGFRNENWKEWKLWGGTPVLVPEKFNTEKEEDGSIYMYAQGDKKYLPCAKMPQKGFYFDSIIRQEKIDDNNLKVEDNLEEFEIISDEELKYIKNKAEQLYNNTKYPIIASLVQSGFGDIAFVPGPALKNPKGIRDITEWYISTVTRKQYIKKIFEKQCEIVLENYRKIKESTGDMIDVVFVTGTDFGAQNGLFISKDSYREMFKPFHIKINNWIHENTEWKSFIHSCGSVYELMPDFIEAGFDILNPVQISASGMEPGRLKKEFGKNIVFWGGGVNTQKTLPFGTPKQVRDEVKRNIEIFGADGGFVFSTVHNLQASVPIKNVIAMIETINEYR